MKNVGTWCRVIILLILCAGSTAVFGADQRAQSAEPQLENARRDMNAGLVGPAAREYAGVAERTGDLDTLYYAAFCYLYAGSYDKADQLVKSILQKRPGAELSVKTKELWGEILLHRRTWDEAVAYFGDLSVSGETARLRAKALVNLGFVHYKKGEATQALHAVSVCCAYYPAYSGWARMFKTIWLARDGFPDAAKRNLQELVREDAGLALLADGQLMFLENSKQPEELACYREAAEFAAAYDDMELENQAIFYLCFRQLRQKDKAGAETTKREYARQKPLGFRMTFEMTDSEAQKYLPAPMSPQTNTVHSN